MGLRCIHQVNPVIESYRWRPTSVYCPLFVHPSVVLPIENPQMQCTRTIFKITIYLSMSLSLMMPKTSLCYRHIIKYIIDHFILSKWNILYNWNNWSTSASTKMTFQTINCYMLEHSTFSLIIQKCI